MKSNEQLRDSMVGIMSLKPKSDFLKEGSWTNQTLKNNWTIREYIGHSNMDAEIHYQDPKVRKSFSPVPTFNIRPYLPESEFPKQ